MGLSNVVNLVEAEVRYKNLRPENGGTQCRNFPAGFLLGPGAANKFATGFRGSVVIVCNLGRKW